MAHVVAYSNADHNARASGYGIMQDAVMDEVRSDS